LICNSPVEEKFAFAPLLGGMATRSEDGSIGSMEVINVAIFNVSVPSTGMVCGGGEEIAGVQVRLTTFTVHGALVHPAAFRTVRVTWPACETVIDEPVLPVLQMYPAKPTGAVRVADIDGHNSIWLFTSATEDVPTGTGGTT